MTTDDVGTTSLAVRLRSAERQLELHLLPLLREHDLTMEQWRVLSVLLARPGIAMTTLAEDAVLPAPSLTRHLDRLVGRALVVRRVDAQDRRRVVAALSERGAALARRLLERERGVAQQDDGTTATPPRLLGLLHD